MNKMDRRSFFKWMGIGSLAVMGAPVALKSFSSRAHAAEGDFSMVDPKGPTAVAVQYVEDFKSSKTAAGKKCSDCKIFQKLKTVGGKDFGTCPVFANQMFPANAYCIAFQAKS